MQLEEEEALGLKLLILPFKHYFLFNITAMLSFLLGFIHDRVEKLLKWHEDHRTVRNVCQCRLRSYCHIGMYVGNITALDNRQ